MPPKKQPARPTPPPAVAPVEVVDPKWLLKAGALAIGAALLFAYVATCALFYKAQWQLVLTPSHADSHQPGEFGLAARAVAFGTDESGKPQIKGWVLPAEGSASEWVLLLPGAKGSAGDALARAKTFHDLGYNALVFDYRGFGASGGQHPTEAGMEKDSEDALAFLRSQPGFAPAQAVVYGAGAGASLAVRLAGEHPELAAVVLEEVDGDFASRARLDPRAKPVPFDLLFHENFPLADPLHTLTKPKLLISYTMGAPPLVVKRAGDPKMVLEVPGAGDPGIATGLRRFLDMYIARAPESLLQGAP